MSNRSALFLSVASLVTLLTLCGGPSVRAQNAKSWVANYGSDALPCTLAQPCASLQRAHDQTVAGGEVGALTPGDYGGAGIPNQLAINKSIGITNDGTGETGILAIFERGIAVNTGAGGVVSLRGLVIDGQGGGTEGIHIFSASAVHIQNCVIRNFEGSGAVGIFVRVGNNTALFVSDSIIFNNGNVSDTGGIWITVFGAGSATVVLDRVHLENNVFGLLADGTQSTGKGIHVTVRDSVVSGNASNGIWAFRPTAGGSSTVILVDRTAALNNAGAGVLADTSGVVQISNSTIEYNGSGASVVNGGRLFSYGNNVIDNNLGEDLSPAAIARTTR